MIAAEAGSHRGLAFEVQQHAADIASYGRCRGRRSSAPPGHPGRRGSRRCLRRVRARVSRHDRARRGWRGRPASHARVPGARRRWRRRRPALARPVPAAPPSPRPADGAERLLHAAAEIGDPGLRQQRPACARVTGRDSTLSITAGVRTREPCTDLAHDVATIARDSSAVSGTSMKQATAARWRDPRRKPAGCGRTATGRASPRRSCPAGCWACRRPAGSRAAHRCVANARGGDADARASAWSAAISQTPPEIETRPSRDRGHGPAAPAARR